MTKTNSALIDVNEVRRAMTLFLPAGQVTELRAFDAAVGGGKYLEIYAGWFDSPDAVAEAVVTLSTFSNLYFLPNPVRPELRGRIYNKLRAAKKTPLTSDADILSRHWLLIDLDPVRPAQISSTDDQHDAALRLARRIRDELRAEGWPLPILADSGNGAHLLFRLELPADDGGVMQRCLQSLASRYDTPEIHVDVTTFNPARLWKLYGSRAGKGDADAANLGMPQRQSRLLEVPK
jgi:hypothetical protein